MVRDKSFYSLTHMSPPFQFVLLSLFLLSPHLRAGEPPREWSLSLRIHFSGDFLQSQMADGDPLPGDWDRILRMNLKHQKLELLPRNHPFTTGVPEPPGRHAGDPFDFDALFGPEDPEKRPPPRGIPDEAATEIFFLARDAVQATRFPDHPPPEEERPEKYRMSLDLSTPGQSIFASTGWIPADHPPPPHFRELLLSLRPFIDEEKHRLYRLLHLDGAWPDDEAAGPEHGQGNR